MLPEFLPSSSASQDEKLIWAYLDSTTNHWNLTIARGQKGGIAGDAVITARFIWCHGNSLFKYPLPKMG